MKKGDLKRSGILETAEKLFFERGYEQTSVQDILDALSLSKGGFYHYFSSKEAILEEICANRAVERLDRLGAEVYSRRLSPIEKLNIVLRKVSLLENEDPRYVALLLKICYLDRDVRMRDHMRTITAQRLRGYLRDVIAEGVRTEDFFVRYPGQIGEIVLSMTADADDAACRILSSEAENPECIIEIAEMLHAYRDAIATLLGAPFGSVELFDMENFVKEYRAAADELLKLEAAK